MTANAQARLPVRKKTEDLYWIMNWSMLLDGLLFWWLILAVGGVLQMILGAWIVFSKDMVYDVYEVCGRAWPLDPEVNQLLGGILTYIPPAMMSILGILLMLRRAMHQDGKYTHHPKQMEKTTS